MPFSGMLRCVALVITEVWEECITSIIRVTRIGELRTTLALTRKRRTLRRNLRSLVTANVVPSSLILVTVMMKALVPLKRRLLQEPHGVTSQKTAFVIVTAVKTSNLCKI
jgi:hypothetical protein